MFDCSKKYQALIAKPIFFQTKSKSLNKVLSKWYDEIVQIIDLSITNSQAS